MTKKKTSKFRSNLEKTIADLLEQLGVSYLYESEKLSYTIEHHYTPDFILPNYTYLEAKGYWSAEDRRKILAVKRDNPDVDLRMIFQSPYIPLIYIYNIYNTYPMYIYIYTIYIQ